MVCYAATAASQSQTVSKACQLRLLNIPTLPSPPYPPKCPCLLWEPSGFLASPLHRLTTCSCEGPSLTPPVCSAFDSSPSSIQSQGELRDLDRVLSVV